MSHPGGARRAVLIAATMAAVVVGPAPAARAHSELVATDPPAGAKLTAAPAEAALTFSESVQPQFATVVVSVAGTADQEVATQVDGPVVTAELPDPASLATGDAQPWRVTYRVVSGDGHPITGTVDFTVSSPASPTTEPAPPSSPATSPETRAGAAQPPTAGDSSATTAAAAEVAAARASPPWGWFLASALFMGLVAGWAVVLARRQRRRAQT